MTEITYEKQFTTIDDNEHDLDHIHDFYELYVNLSGDVSFMVEDRIYPLQRGDIIVTKPNELHRCIYHSSCIHEHFCIWIKGLPLDSDTWTAQFVKHTLVVLSDDMKEQLITHCFGLYKHYQEEASLRFRAAYHFFGILDIISSGKPLHVSEQYLPIHITEILLYISRHFSETACNTTQISEKFYISKSTLRRHFMEYFQTTPSQYIESRRFAEAKKLLLTGHSVQYTCFHSGFSDCSYFVMRFRKKFGITPRQYQKLRSETETKP